MWWKSPFQTSSVLLPAAPERESRGLLLLFLAGYMYSLFPSFLSHFLSLSFSIFPHFAFSLSFPFLPPLTLLPSPWFYYTWEVTLHSCNRCKPPAMNHPNKSLCVWNLTLFVQWHHSTISCSLHVELHSFKVNLMCFTREKACSLQKQLWDLKILPFSQTPDVYYWSVLGRMGIWESCSQCAWLSAVQTFQVILQGCVIVKPHLHPLKQLLAPEIAPFSKKLFPN